MLYKTVNKGFFSVSPRKEGEREGDVRPGGSARPGRLNTGAFAAQGNHADQAKMQRLRGFQARKRGTLAGIPEASHPNRYARRADGKWREI